MAQKNLYKLLLVDPEADPDVIEAAHHVLAARLHPELDVSGIAEVRLAELDRALAILSDPARRAAYDAERTLVAFTIRTNGDAGPDGHNGGLAERIARQTPDDEGAQLRIDFGRYAGSTLGELLRTDPDYLRWLSRHSSGIRFRGPILRLLAQHAVDRRPVGTNP